MKQVARLLMAALTLTGCAHRSVIQEETDEFVGKPLSVVTTKLAPPRKSTRSMALEYILGRAVPRAVVRKQTAQYGWS
jgi:hypothetical protein